MWKKAPISLWSNRPALPRYHPARPENSTACAAYNVSGEFAMIKAAAQLGWLDGERLWWSLDVHQRCRADIIITYFAQDTAKLLNP